MWCDVCCGGDCGVAFLVNDVMMVVFILMLMMNKVIRIMVIAVTIDKSNATTAIVVVFVCL